MTGSITIRDAIITLLTNQDPKNGNGVGVQKWFKGQPPKSRWLGKPWGWVEVNSFDAKAPTTTKQLIEETFYIVVVDKDINQDHAEDSVCQFIEAIKDALKTDPTLGGLLGTSYPTHADKEKNFEGDYSVVAMRLTLYTRRRE